VKTRIILLGLALAANLAQADMFNKGRERNIGTFIDDGPWQEQVLPLPAYGNADWVALDLPATIKNRLFIDRATLLLADDRTIRFTLRQLSQGGIENISYEGLHCGQRTVRSFAFGDTVNKRWIASARTDWRKLDGNSVTWKNVSQALCPDNTPPLNAEELQRNLQAASAPSAASGTAPRKR
jgi:hypothetical protein